MVLVTTPAHYWGLGSLFLRIGCKRNSVVSSHSPDLFYKQCLEFRHSIDIFDSIIQVCDVRISVNRN